MEARKLVAFKVEEHVWTKFKELCRKNETYVSTELRKFVKKYNNQTDGLGGFNY